MSIRSSILLSSPMFLGLFLVACNQDLDTANEAEESVDSASQAIIRGENTALADSRVSGVVNLRTGPATQAGYINTCTGTLLNSRWVILAAHCFNPAQDADGNGEIDSTAGTSYQVRIGNEATDITTIAVERALRHPNGTWGSGGGTDVALMRLAQDAPASALPAAYYSSGRLPIYPGNPASLVGATVTEMGYGCNAGTIVNGVATGVSGNGTLRQSRLPINWNNATLVATQSHNGSGLTCFGDSGGPMFLDDYSPARTRYLVGVHSTSDLDLANGWSDSTASQAFRDWVESTVFGAAAARLDCTNGGLTCVSGPASLPNNVNFVTAFVPYGANQSRCYDVDVDYNMETNWDYVTIAGVPLTGQGRYTTHYCGALPVKLTTDGSVASAGVTLTARNLVEGYQCTINPVAGTTNCSGNVTAQAASGMATAAIDLTNFREAYISAQICNPTGWVLNIGDSPSNNGGSGDGGEFSNDAELEIQGTQLNVLGRDGSNPVVQFQDSSFVGSTDCTWRSFKIADRTIEVGEKNIRLASDNLIRINQPDTEGQPNALIYMGLNRVIGGTFRSGSGVQQATVLLRR